ncbi:MAG TPA: hypothetical protein VFF53_13055 [Geobacteraceae bacterium]|nr:hypothetical protein [Geobacteraceae bacterium]
MINHYLGHKRLPLTLALLVAFCLLIAGMRVPDLSRPHRAKPSHRAVIENPTQTCQPSIKKTFELLALIPSITTLSLPHSERTDFQTSSPTSCFSPLFHNSARAPPPLFS